mmetsp:Transcript_36694/g.114231  ORF Transcript_36694/g.114231 Transcript_36694/m.114231 type:complete len:206 (+) Transcript_36694:2-619(+)
MYGRSSVSSRSVSSRCKAAWRSSSRRRWRSASGGTGPASSQAAWPLESSSPWAASPWWRFWGCSAFSPSTRPTTLHSWQSRCWSASLGAWAAATSPHMCTPSCWASSLSPCAWPPPARSWHHAWASKVSCTWPCHCSQDGPWVPSSRPLWHGAWEAIRCGAAWRRSSLCCRWGGCCSTWGTSSRTATPMTSCTSSSAWTPRCWLL